MNWLILRSGLYNLTICGGRNHREQDVGEYTPGNAGYAPYRYQNNHHHCQKPLPLISLPTDFFNFKGKHRYLRYHQPGEQSDQDKDRWENNIAAACYIGNGHAEAYPEKTIGGCGQSPERGCLSLIDVKFGQAQRRKQRNYKSQIGNIYL